DVPVEKSGARIGCVGVAIEEIVHGKLSDRDGEPRDVLLAGDLVGTILDRFLLAAETECLAQEYASDIAARHRKVRLLRFAIGKPCEAKRAAQAETLGEV